MNSKSVSANLKLTGIYWPFQNWFAFQINHPSESTTASRDSQIFLAANYRKLFLLEAFCVFTVFAAFTFSITPGVNESHYLTKAKHFWNPDWCANDIFLSSANAHFLFFLICGWPSLFVSLDAFAWIGRVFCWLFAAIAWTDLNRSISIRPGYATVSSLFFVLLISKFNLAGEWVVGGFEAKSVAYIFVIWGVALYLKSQLKWCWPVLGVATGFHAVVGIWSLSCLCFAILTRAMLSRSWSSLRINDLGFANFWVSLLLTFLFVAIGCFPPIAADWNTPDYVVSTSSEIQVQDRLGHHLLFEQFPIAHVARFTIVVVLFFAMFRFVRHDSRMERLYFFCIGGLLISLSGLFISGIAEARDSNYDLANRLLRYYWFRFSDFSVPLGISLTIGILVGKLTTSNVAAKRYLVQSSLFCLLLAGIIWQFQSVGDFRSGADRLTLPTYTDDPMRTHQTYENWKKACQWIRMNTRTDAIFLTPHQFQTFKWFAHRSEFACWKDIPQDAESIVEWRKRISMQQAMQNHFVGGVFGIDESNLKFLVEEYGITNIIAPQADEDAADFEDVQFKYIKLNRLYPTDRLTKSTFVIYNVQLESQTSN